MSENKIDSYVKQMLDVSSDVSHGWQDSLGAKVASGIEVIAGDIGAFSSEYSETTDALHECLNLCEEILNGAGGDDDEPPIKEKVLVKRR